MTRVLDKQEVKEQEINRLRLIYQDTLNTLDKVAKAYKEMEEIYTKECNRYKAIKGQFDVVRKNYENALKEVNKAWEDLYDATHD